MAPSGGVLFSSDDKCFRVRWLLHFFVRFLIVILLQSADTNGAAVAKIRYYMDYSPDCVLSGVQDIPRNQVTYVSVYAQSARSNALSCILQFAPQESGDTLRMWFERDPFIGDCKVSLTATMSDSDRYILGCQSSSRTPEMEAMDGKAKLHFVRTNVGSTSYGFTVGIQAVRSVDPEGPGDSSTDDVGMIVGIIAGAVVFIIILLVLCICCYRKQKRDAAFKVQGVTVQSNAAFENGKMNPDYTGGSPSSEKRLLAKASHDYDVEDPGSKPKSALERFGPMPARRSDRPSNSTDKSSNEKNGNENWSNRDDKADPQRSPILNDLRNNPKFRRSLHEMGGDRDRVNGSNESSASYNSNGVPLPPKLPPVPRSPQRSPSPQRKGEKIAGIFRSRPSSSSSEIAKQLEGDRPDNGDYSPSEFVPSPRRDEKSDTRHVLRPNRGERKPTLAEERRRMKEEQDNESEEDGRGRNRERYRRDDEKKRKEVEAERESKRREEERERQRRMEEEEEEREEEEKRRRKKEREREKRRQEEEDEEDEREKEQERKERRRRKDKEREREDERLEGRFKKSASGRRSKGKGPRMGRSKSTSNALEEMETQYQRSRSKSPSSVRSLNFIEDDDDDDLDSNYMPFKRAGSKTSLYASRSSLYGRRRKNSMGETISLSSYAINDDDLDSRYGDFDRRGLSLSRRDKDKMFKSTGELEMHGATAQVVRECATQTDSSKAVYVYGRKTLAKCRPGKMYSRGCQTGRTRRDSNASARSGRSSRMRKSKSTESLRKRSRSRNLDESYDSSDDRLSHKSRSRRNLDDSYDSDNRSRKHRSRSRNLDYSDDDDGRRSNRKKKHHRSKSRGLEDDDDYDNRSSKGKPRARPRKSTGAASVDLSDSDGGRSAAASSYMPPQPTNPYGAQYIPVMFPPPTGIPYQPGAPGGPPMVPGMAPVIRPGGPKPPIAPKPKKSKWDELVEITDKEKHRPRNQRPDSPTESMLTSIYSHPPANGGLQQNYYAAPPSYTTAQKYPNPPNPNSTISSAYPDSSGMPLSGIGNRHYGYGPSESEI